MAGENFDKFGETIIIHQHFTQPNSRFTIVTNVFLTKTLKTIDLPKFYPANILRYTVIILYILCSYVVVVQHPINTTVCQDDDATFTCVVFLSSGFPSTPQWARNSVTVDMIRHAITSNLSGGASAPAYISGTVTVSNVTVLDDDEALYQCGSGSITSNSGTLNVVGKGMCMS